MLRRIEFRRLVALLMLVFLLAAPMMVLAQEGGEGEGEEAATETEASVEGGAVEEASVSPLAPLGINQGFLFAQIFNFLLLFGVLTIFLWRPIMNMLDNRAATIAKGLEDAAAAANARRNAEAEVEGILSKARAEAAQIIEEARGRGDEVAKTIEAEARKEGDRIRTEARATAQAERNTELAGLRGQVASISVAVAQRLIGESLDEKRQKALIDDFFTKVPAGSANLGSSVEVVSAMPLSDAEQAKVKQQVGASDVTFSVDPAILGGLIIRSADHVVDGSVRRGLTELSGRLN